jgi:hypothetical protein
MMQNADHLATGRDLGQQAYSTRGGFTDSFGALLFKKGSVEKQN